MFCADTLSCIVKMSRASKPIVHLARAKCKGVIAVNTIVAVVLSPIGLAAAFARPFLSFGGFLFLFCGCWAYLNLGWADPAFAWRLFGVAATCYGLRYGAEILRR